MMNRITANDGITKSKQLKCMFDVQFHRICIKISFQNSKDAILSKKYVNFYDSGAIVIVCIAALHYARCTIYGIMESLSGYMGSGTGIIFVQKSAPVFCG